MRDRDSVHAERAVYCMGVLGAGRAGDVVGGAGVSSCVGRWCRGSVRGLSGVFTICCISCSPFLLREARMFVLTFLGSCNPRLPHTASPLWILVRMQARLL